MPTARLSWLAVLLAHLACSADSPRGGSPDEDPRRAKDDTPVDPGPDGDPGPADGDPAGGDADGGDADDEPADPCTMREGRVPAQEPVWERVPDDETVTYVENPPASGPHRAMWARYQIHEEAIDREYWVHNLRRGAIVIVYRPDAPTEVQSALRAAYDAIPLYDPPGSARPVKLALMTPDPRLDDPYAVLSWGFMLTSSCVPDAAAVVDFAVRRVDRGYESGKYGEGLVPSVGPCFQFITVKDNQWTRVVAEDEPLDYAHNPPTSGPHWETLAPYGELETVVPRGNWVGNLPLGGMIVTYRPDAPAELIQTLNDAVLAVPNYWECDGHNLTLLTPDPYLPAAMPFAVVSWNEYMTAQCTDVATLKGYILERRYHGETPSCEQGPQPTQP
jgi:hypothetical protein